MNLLLLIFLPLAVGAPVYLLRRFWTAAVCLSVAAILALIGIWARTPLGQTGYLLGRELILDDLNRLLLLLFYVLALLMILVTLLAILIAIVAFWLYRFFGERHYGRRAALRWALFGFTFAVWLHTLGWIFQDRLAILKGILQFLGVFATYFLTRKLIPFKISDN